MSFLDLSSVGEVYLACGYTDVTIDGKTISFKAPYRRLPILDAIKEKTGYDLNGMSLTRSTTS